MNPKNWQLSFFRREQRSLFGEILDWMLTPLLLLWPISLVLTWLVALLAVMATAVGVIWPNLLPQALPTVLVP